MSANDAPLVSLIIPAYNEAALLPRLLDSVDLARARFHRGAGAVEVVVADNSSTDATAEIARRRGCRIATVEKRVIAAARNGGAAVARGAVLCFIDADSRIHPETFNEIERTLHSGRVIAGATGVELERWSLGLRCTWLLLMSLVLLTGMDTGVVFCRRQDFDAVGGYDERLPVAEDVDFLWRLRRLGRPRGQRLGRTRHAKSVASTRKFDRYGDWHYFTAMPRHAWKMLRSPHAVTEFARQYWYGDR